MAFRPRIANEGNSAMAYSFATIATPGTTPRCWYYMLREIDPRARRYSAIVLPVDDYDDEDWEDLAGRVSDLYYLLPILRVSDLREFSMSYPANAARWDACRGGLLKGWSYRRDFQDLLVNHKRRMLEVNWTRTESAKSFYNFVWTTNSLKGMNVDWAARKISYPPDTTEEQKRVLNNVLLRTTAPQVGYLAAYRRKWFGKIVEHYRGSHTRLIFLRLPRGPVVRPYPVVKKSSSIREFASHPQVALLDEHLFDELEHPELFVDSLHMNGPGSARFSELLAAEVARILGR